jgi:hypothetical protein
MPSSGRCFQGRNPLVKIPVHPPNQVTKVPVFSRPKRKFLEQFYLLQENFASHGESNQTAQQGKIGENACHNCPYFCNKIYYSKA